MELFNCIKSRNSIRKYIPEKIVKHTDIIKILQAAICAPSYKNMQPWKIYIVEEKNLIKEICNRSIYYKWMKDAPLIFAVFLDNKISYNRIKDLQSVGAFIQNILLECNDLGLGACWIGEILNSKEQINELLHIEKQYELMAIITIGHKSFPETSKSKKRKHIDKFILGWKKQNEKNSLLQ